MCQKKMYLHVSVLGLFGMESLLKNKTLGDVQSSGHLLLEDESCYKQQVYNWKVYLQTWIWL